MELSSDRNGHSSHGAHADRSSDGSSGSKRSQDHHLCPPAPPLPPSSAPDERAPSPASQLRFRVRLTKPDVCTQPDAQAIDAVCIRSGSTCSNQGRHSITGTTTCGKFMPRDEADDALRAFDSLGEDMSRSTKKSRIDDHKVGGGVPEHRKNWDSKEGKFAGKGLGTETGVGHDRDDQFFKGSVEHLDHLPAAKKAEKSSGKGDHCAQMTSERGRPLSATRLPHKKAFKTMRALSEVRDCIIEKQGVRSHKSADSRGSLERTSPPKSDGGVENEKDSQAEGTLTGCDDYVRGFPFVLPRALKRVRSSRDVQGHKKLANTESHLQDVRTTVEKASKEDLRVSEVVKMNCMDSDSLEKIQGEKKADMPIKGDDAKAEQSTHEEEGKIKDRSVARSFSSEVERRGESPLQADGMHTLKLNVGDKHGVQCTKASNTDAEMAGDMNCSAPKEEAVGVISCERPSQHDSEYEEQEKALRVLRCKGGGDRPCYQAAHEMAQEAAEGDVPASQRDHQIVRDLVGGHSTTSGLLATETSCIAAQGELDLNFLDEFPESREHPAIERSEIDKKRDTSKGMLGTLFANSADVCGKNKEGFTMMDDYERNYQLKRVPGLQAFSSRDGTECIANKVGGYVTHGLIQKPSEAETFQLSLAPPGTLAAEAGHASNSKHGPIAPSSTSDLPVHTCPQSRTETQNLSQSQRCSDGYTTSMSFSQSLLHNPSCSLACFSAEHQELSCGGSRHLSQGNESMSTRGQPTASMNENDGFFSLVGEKSKQGQGFPLYQLPKQNESKDSGRIHENIATGVEARVVPWKSKLSTDDNEVLVTHNRKHKDLQVGSFQQEEEVQHLMEAWYKPPAEKREVNQPTSSAGRHSTAKSELPRGDENQLGGHFGLQEIAAEPVGIMAQRMQELPDSFLDSLRDLARDLLCNFEKRGEFLALQRIVKSRRDLTENTLLHAQRTQLEILVALKTGEQDFVQVSTKSLTYKALTEIFLQTRCRNVACQQSLPVDECDCKVCSQKVGFCHECMCVVCSKFDSDNHTCRWVGCEFCMHWCHADCGLRMSHIAPARSNKGAAGTTEMLYQCVVCGHSSELFGLVRNVFQLFSENWDAEMFTKELDSVRRIFHGSEDVRGRQLCRKAEILLQEVDMRVDIPDIRRSILRYFNEANLHADGVPAVASKQSTQINGPLDGKARTMLEASTQVAPTVENKLADERKMRDFCAEKIENIAELHVGQARKQAEIDNAHSMVRLKQAEAEMLQRRADEAHKQARGLQQIISAKQDKIEGDYMCKYAKLRLNEAEEEKRRRLLELQALERAHLDYQSMKLRMEAQIKDLGMRMGRASWQYA